MARKFDTLRIGVVNVEGWRIDVRLIRDRTAHFVVSTGDVGAPLPNLEAAIVQATQTFPGLTWREGFELEADEAVCPICEMPVAKNPRYPRQLCKVCVLEAVDASGNGLRFYNTALSGGFEARCSDGKTSEDHACFVRGVPCHADEAYFGGIVVQPVGVSRYSAG